MFEVRWTEQAVRRLEGVLDFLAQKDVEAALRVEERIVSRSESLSEHPKQGRVYAGTSGGEVRELLVQSYRVIYEVDEQAGRVWILSVRHQRQERPPSEGL